MNNHTSSLENTHFPVMLNEVIKISKPSKGGTYIDCTFGGGSYSKKLLNFSKTKVKGLDRDEKVKEIGKNLEKKFPQRFKFYQTKFSQLENVTKELVDVIIFDLGLSSIQIGAAIYFGSYISLILIPVFIVYITKKQIYFEETSLEKKFGQDFLKYSNRVRRWI